MFTLDCRNMESQEAVIKCKNYIEAENAQEFAVILDNDEAVDNVTAYGKNNGYVVETKKIAGNIFELILEKNSESQIEESPLSVDEGMNKEVPSFQKTRFFTDTEIFNKHPLFKKEGENYSDYLAEDMENKTVVLLSTDCLGHGSDELGARLMENFVAGLCEIPVWQIVLMNGGVRLACAGGNVFESFKKLAEKGVKIHVCGTSLAYFGLLEQKKIGESSSMIQILECLEKADKIIRP